MNTIKIDKKYKGIKRIDNGDYVINGDLIIEGNLEIFLDDRLRIKGDNKISGYMIANNSIFVDGSQTVDGYQEVGGFQTVDGSQEVGGFQEVDGFQNVNGSQTVDGYQKVDGFQKVNGFQEVYEYQEVNGFQKVDGDSFVSLGRCVMLSIDIKGIMTTGLRIFAGVCNWRNISDSDKEIRCKKQSGGHIIHGDLIIEQPKHTIKFDGKEIELSEESYQSIKEQFNK